MRIRGLGLGTEGLGSRTLGGNDASLLGTIAEWGRAVQGVVYAFS